jgi:exopolysaccharide production protein ExoQ
LPAVTLEDFASLLILLFFGMAGSIPGIAPNQATEMTGAQASGLMFVVGVGSQVIIDALIAVLLLRHAPQLRRQGRALQWVGALSLLAVFSAAWSQDPVLTLRRAIPFALAAAFGLLLASRMPLRRQLLLMEAAFVLLALASAALALACPSLGLDASTGHGGNWQGVFTQKNACGRAMVFASAAVLAQGSLTLRRILSLLLFTAVLLMSGSRGAWGIDLLLFGVLGALWCVCRFKRLQRLPLVALASGAALSVGALAKLYFASLATMVGRDATLTGRTAIWEQVWIAIWKRPWLGYGFSAFWRGTKGASFEVVVALKFVLFHAHNGFLEIWLELGLAGLFLFALSYRKACAGLWPRIQGGSYEAAAWPLAVLVLIAAYDFDENTLLSFNGLFWVLYAQAVAVVELGLSDHASLAAPQRARMFTGLLSGERSFQCR